MTLGGVSEKLHCFTAGPKRRKLCSGVQRATVHKREGTSGRKWAARGRHVLTALLRLGLLQLPEVLRDAVLGRT